jgi:low affinity Fe/Cu permease
VSLKLDELLRGVEGARTGLVNLDHMSDEELERVQAEFAQLPQRYAPLLEDHLEHLEFELHRRKKRHNSHRP